MSAESLRLYRNQLIELMTTYYEDTRYLTDGECEQLLDAVAQKAQELRGCIIERHGEDFQYDERD